MKKQYHAATLSLMLLSFTGFVATESLALAGPKARHEKRVARREDRQKLRQERRKMRHDRNNKAQDLQQQAADAPKPAEGATP